MKKLDLEALEYHRSFPAGKTGIRPVKPTASQHDLAMAYTPGVAAPSEAIADDREKSYDYTGRGNLIAVISNGTAVLGLGDIGPYAAKPVMEGKALLFKILGGVNAFDIELDASDPEVFIQTVKALAPTFGGINLEDIKAPQCFEIERRLVEELDVPVMHDDQHCTAIITAAALVNSLELAGKKDCTVSEIAMRWVFSEGLNIFAVVSASSRERILGNIAALSLPMTAKEAEYLDLRREDHE